MSLDKVLKELEFLKDLDLEERVEAINSLRLKIKEYSPFNKEPVDCVIWTKEEKVLANDYNPNSVAPPEMKLLKTSIDNDGYTQPIVTWKKPDIFEVIDGFHRSRVGKEYEDIKARLHGYLPIVTINAAREKRGDRMASTIRHNRARGKHSIDSMSDIVIELKKRNRSEEWIAKNLGMDKDEITRLCQISGLSELFSDSDFSESWDIDEDALEGQEVIDG